MTSKENVLKILDDNYGNYVSGEKIAKTLGISRNAISKHVLSLKEDGYIIKSEKNNGHMLYSVNDVISNYGIQKYLKFECNTVVFNQLESTNNYLKDNFENINDDFYTVIAKKQTKGKGRLGRSFYSPNETGIYFSFLIKPEFNINLSNTITTFASVAVRRAIRKVFPQIDPKIKWVNDIYVENKKVCGILTEGLYNVELGKFDYIIVGIGINVYIPETGFPKEIEDIAGYLTCEKINDGKNLLIANVLNEFHDIYEKHDVDEINKEYKENCFIIGKRVRVIQNGVEKEATVKDIDELFRLVVIYDNGEIDILQSGEISIRL